MKLFATSMSVLGALTLGIGLFTLPAAPALADVDSPECIAPANPGGGFDLTCRIAESGLGNAHGRPIRVTFMPGGIGAVAFNLFNTTRTDDGNAIVAFSSGSLLNIATGKYGAGRVIVRAAPPGTGIIAGGPMRAVFETLGVQDVVAKSIGSANPHNMVKATFVALQGMASPRAVAARRGLKVGEVLGRRRGEAEAEED